MCVCVCVCVCECVCVSERERERANEPTNSIDVFSISHHAYSPADDKVHLINFISLSQQEMPLHQLFRLQYRHQSSAGTLGHGRKLRVELGEESSMEVDLNVSPQELGKPMKHLIGQETIVFLYCVYYFCTQLKKIIICVGSLRIKKKIPMCL